MPALLLQATERLKQAWFPASSATNNANVQRRTDISAPSFFLTAKIIAFLKLLIAVVVWVGNGTIVIATIRSKNLRSKCNILIAIQAFSDAVSQLRRRHHLLHPYSSSKARDVPGIQSNQQVTQHSDSCLSLRLVLVNVCRFQFPCVKSQPPNIYRL
ncbi:hypothetical protein QR680_015513 [Steinernema hermaphroditum]|uniref:G-protein coupled receptors family 1 profile domain-containing protein n=1 Tax=Steinernema hermaphroditum TaxID=289476 RepID=A0AA39LKU8_9BILA|nr:hypothetical protein QR680_015513 [Steinernema hermaphroditum]